MFEPDSEEEVASALVAGHGARARQKVVDRIVAAIRLYDMPTAKTWDRIGALVDEKLGTPRPEDSELDVERFSMRPNAQLSLRGHPGFRDSKTVELSEPMSHPED